MTDQAFLVEIFLFCTFIIIYIISVAIAIYYISNQRKKMGQLISEGEALRLTLQSTGKMEYHEIKKAIEEQTNKKNQILSDIKAIYDAWEKKKQDLTQQDNEIINQINSKRSELIVLDDEILLQSFGFYKPRYSLQNTEAYKIKLDQIRTKQEEMVKSGNAASGSTAWTLNNDKREGARMIKDYVKLILRSFNNECDASINNVKFNNIEVIEKKLRKAFDVLNNLGRRMTITISMDYLNSKLQELYLVYEYQVMKQQEKEEQKKLREQMHEEAKALKEIEDMKIKLEKEEKHFNNALEENNVRLANAKTQEDIKLLDEERNNILLRMKEIEKDKQDVINRENNTRAGFVYIISNIGSFGENIYKIGVTRRLDPTERVDELGDASVPFDFDIHATIFSDDAPALENALHKAFEKRRINCINLRREFFNVTLDEIEDVVKKNFTKPIELTRLPDAEEFRQTRKLKESLLNQ